MLNETAFAGANQSRWSRLSDLVNRAEASLKTLPSQDLMELIRLYRQASADLALLRTDQANPRLTADLNALVARAHSVIYRRPMKRVGEAIKVALFAAADTTRRRKVFIFASILIFFISCAFNWTVLATRPDLRPEVIPPGSEELFAHWKEGKFDERDFDQDSMMTAFYMSNNPFVAIRMATVSAATFGVGTVESLHQNGTVMGALAYEMNSVGKLGFLIGSIYPHGASELNGMFMAGAAGLLMGYSLLCPGRRTRVQALREGGKDAMVMACQAVVMMFIAAPFEGYFSFNPAVPQPLKWVVGTIVLAAWLAFWSFYGKGRTE